MTSSRDFSERVTVDFTKRVIIVGHESVGKSSLLSRVKDRVFPNNPMPTIGVDYRLINLDRPKEFSKELKNYNDPQLMFWDTAGSEHFRQIITSYFKGASAIVYVVNSAQPLKEQLPTLVALKSAVEENDNTPGGVISFLVVNKIDEPQKLTGSDITKVRKLLGLDDEDSDSYVFHLSAKTSSQKDVQRLPAIILEKLVERHVEQLNQLKVEEKGAPEDPSVKSVSWWDTITNTILHPLGGESPPALPEEQKQKPLRVSFSASRQKVVPRLPRVIEETLLPHAVEQEAREECPSDIFEESILLLQGESDFKKYLRQAQARTLKDEGRGISKETALQVARLSFDLASKVAAGQVEVADIKLFHDGVAPSVAQSVELGRIVGGIIGAALGIVLGLAVGAMIGAGLGPGAALTALLAATKGAVTGAAVGAVVGGAVFGWVGSQWSLWHHPLSLMEKTARQMVPPGVPAPAFTQPKPLVDDDESFTHEY